MRDRDGGQLVAETSRYKMPDKVVAEAVVNRERRAPSQSWLCSCSRSIGGPLDVLVFLSHLLGALEFRSCIDRLGDGLGVP